MIAIVDYGVGNLFSLQRSLKAIGANSVVTADSATIRNAQKLILPGVGAFCDAANKLRASGLAEVVCEAAEAGKPLLGVCLGMQLLLEQSSEYGAHKGLGLIPGQVEPIANVISPALKVPHIGWNALSFAKDRPKSVLFRHVQEGEFVYFVHSYHATGCDAYVSATTEYSAPLTAAVESKNVYGCQFHPEKSGLVGLRILRAFEELEA